MKLRFKKRVIEIERIPDTLSEFNEIVEDRTGVPRDRQKLLCRKAWKGNLKSVGDLKAAFKSPTRLEVLLIGTAVSKRTEETVSKKKQVVPSQDKKVASKETKCIYSKDWKDGAKIRVAKGKTTYECFLPPKATYYDLKLLLEKHVPEYPSPSEQRIIQSGKTQDDAAFVCGKRAILMFRKGFYDKKDLEEKIKSATRKYQEIRAFVLSLQSKFEHRISDMASMTIDLGIAEDRIEILLAMIPLSSKELKEKASELTNIVSDLRRRALLVVRRR